MSRPRQAFDRHALAERLNRARPQPELEKAPDNGVSSPTPERLKEAVRQANDPKRLISDSNNFTAR